MKAILWLIANWDTVAQTAATVVGAASMVAASLSALASKLGKPDAEGKLKGVAGALDAVAKNPILQAAALNPRPKSAAAQVVGLRAAGE